MHSVFLAILTSEIIVEKSLFSFFQFIVSSHSLRELAPKIRGYIRKIPVKEFILNHTAGLKRATLLN